MLNKIFSEFFGKKNHAGELVQIRLNDKIMPIGRGDIYEDPLDNFLRTNNYGEVTGGGTMQAKTGEIDFCDLEILIYQNQNINLIINEIITFLEVQGAPKGSSLTREKTSKEIPFGKAEGLAVYLDGVSLPAQVYKECDSNYVLHEIGTLLVDSGNGMRYWQGETETALYFYGESFNEMKRAISEFVAVYPLCKGARIVQIA